MNNNNNIFCKICNKNIQGNGYCAEHSTSGTAYLDTRTTEERNNEPKGITTNSEQEMNEATSEYKKDMEDVYNKGRREATEECLKIINTPLLTNEPNRCEHQFVFSHKAVETVGVQAIYQTVIYVICPKCGLVKWQV